MFRRLSCDISLIIIIFCNFAHARPYVFRKVSIYHDKFFGNLTSKFVDRQAQHDIPLKGHGKARIVVGIFCPQLRWIYNYNYVYTLQINSPIFIAARYLKNF